MNIREFYEYSKKNLPDLDEHTLQNEVNILLEDYLNLSYTNHFLNRNKEISSENLEILKEAINKRSLGIPLQYILGHWEFMGLDLLIGKGVLIPREDTSSVVELAMSCKKFREKNNIIDICSGSGCIALSVEKNLKNNSDIYALEYSPDAFFYLKKNIEKENSSVKPVFGNLYEKYKDFSDGFFDFILSNPPYIKTNEIKTLEKEIFFEPQMALDGGNDGLDFYRGICKLWTPKLKIGGSLIFEIGKGQFEDVKKIMENSGYNSIEFKKDINGIIRAVSGIRNV